MATIADIDRSTADRLARWLKSEKFGDLNFDEVRVERDIDAFDQEAWTFCCVIHIGSANADWALESSISVEDVAEMNRLFRDHALEEGLTYPWYVFIVPDADDEPHPDEADRT